METTSKAFGVVAEVKWTRGNGMAATALRLVMFWGTVIQGSSFLLPSLRYGTARATLGFVTESRWD